MKLTLPALAGVAVLLLSTIAPSVAAAQGASPEATALARRYVAAVHLDRMMDSMMANLVPAMLANLAKKSGGKVPEEVRSALTDAAAESVRAMTPAMVDRMVPAIAESFTVPELQAAVTYYESAPGQSLMAKMPVYMAKLQPGMADLMASAQADMETRVCKKLGCDAAAKR